MTTQEELAIDAHILRASNLKITAPQYEALESLLETGNFLWYYFDNYDIFVGFTRLLNNLGVKFKFVPNGLELLPDAKQIYQQNVMYRKPPEYKPTYYSNSSNRVGKEEPGDDKIGWADRKFPDKS